jgi:hypothetical protein
MSLEGEIMSNRFAAPRISYALPAGLQGPAKARLPRFLASTPKGDYPAERKRGGQGARLA